MTVSPRPAALAVGGFGFIALALTCGVPFINQDAPPSLVDGPPVVLPVSAAVAAAAVLLGHRWPGWLTLIALVLGLGALSLLLAAPTSICWDGVDGQGRPTGGCETTSWTWAAWGFLVGIGLSTVGAVLAAGQWRRQRRTVQAVGAGQTPAAPRT